MKITITGATGFIAQHCITELLAHGYQVRGTVRNINSAIAENPLLQQIELVETDLLNDNGWAEAFADVDAVLHTASPVMLNGSKAQLIKPAVEGTERVMRAAANAGVKRIVITSSTAAIVNTEADVYSEEHWSEPERCTPYPKSKTLAEKAAWDFIAALPEDQRPELVACNPCVVFGPTLSDTVSESISLVQRLMERSIPALPDIGFSLVDVRDVAAAHRLALEVPEAAGNRYLLSAEFYWLKDISRTLHDAFHDQGYRPTSRHLPYPLVWLASHVSPLARSLRDDIGKRSYHDTSKARSELNWQPRSVEETIIQTASSLIERGLIKN